MRPLGNDRSSFPSNPPETDRKIERLRDEDSILETRAATGSVTFEVTGAIPEFTGVPAGLQQFYVAPIVVNDSINMTNTVSIGGTNYLFYEDFSNVFNTGTSSAVGYRNSSSAAIYNFVDGSASFLSHTNLGSTRGFRVGSLFAVSTIYSAVTSPQVCVIENGIFSIVTLTAPPGTPVCYSTGISEDETKICAFWANANTVGSGTVRISLHNLDGSLVGYTSLFSVSRVSPNVLDIDNGWVVYANSTQGIFAIKSNLNVGNQFTLVSNVPPASTAGYASFNVTDDNHYYFFAASGFQDDLFRVNLQTSVTSVFPDVIARFTGSPPTKNIQIIPQCMFGISSDKMVFGGYYYYLADSPAVFYPIYCSVEFAGGGANVSDSLFTEYGSTSFSPLLSSVYAITRMSNADVIFAMKTPADDFLVKVTGP